MSGTLYLDLYGLEVQVDYSHEAPEPATLDHPGSAGSTSIEDAHIVVEVGTQDQSAKVSFSIIDMLMDHPTLYDMILAQVNDYLDSRGDDEGPSPDDWLDARKDDELEGV